MRTLISVASFCTLLAIAVSNSACSRTTHTSVTDKNQPKPVVPDADATQREPLPTDPDIKFPERPRDFSEPTDLQTPPEVIPREAPPPVLPPHEEPLTPPVLPPNQPSEPSKPADETRPPKPAPEEETKEPQSDADIKLAAQVRTAIITDVTVSGVADSVTVVARAGAVTLQGRVKDQEQKDAIETIAKGVAGVESVDNQLVFPR